MPAPPAAQRGIVLIAVVLVLALLASITLMLSGSTGIDNSLLRQQAENVTLDYLVESGLAHASWTLAQNSTCAGYTNMSSTAFGNHSYSATLTPTTGSPVTIIATGTLNTGTTRALTRSFVTAYQAPTVDTLQPGPEGIDTYIWDGAHKDTNFGITAYVELNNASAERVILMRFDLSGLPPGAAIVGATLELWLEGGNALSNGVIDAHRVTQSWFEGEEDDNPPSTPGATYLRYDGSVPAALWANPGGGGDYDPVPVSTTVIPNLNQAWHQWDITALAQNGSQSELANNGVLLRASGGNVDKIKFTSSDGNTQERPKLTINYSCPCGTSCPAGGSAGTKLLFVVGNVGGPGLTAEETAHQALVESWGYTVEIIDDSASQAEFDTAVANNDVVFTTNDIGSSSLDTKLVDAAIGVVTSEDNLSDEFGISSGIDWDSGTTVEVNDNTHYITSPFALGALTIFGSSESLAYVTGALSPDLGELASSSSGFDIVTLEAGAAMFGSGTAAGRRVQLPWGGSPSLEPNDLTADGRTILKRSLEWATGAGSATTIETRIADTDDDAEQRIGDGYMDLSSSDLELAFDIDGSQTNLAGMRFAGVAVPQGATISNAHIQFQVDEPRSGATNLSVFGQNIDNADQFTTTDFDISDRAPTAASVPWAVPPWNTVGEAGPDQRTANIAAIIQEIVNRPGWSRGNALVVMILGSGTRTAESYDGDPNGAPLLHIEYGGAGGSGGGQHYLDEFNAVAYDGNDGTLDWSGDWQEVGESDGPNGGFLRVVNDADCSSSTCLRIGHANSDVTQRILDREADLSGADAWTLSYDYATSGADRGFIHVEASGDDGSNWFLLTSYDFDSGDVSGSESFDISSFIVPDTQIRFRLVNRNDDASSSDQIRGLMYIDNVKIEPAGGGSCNGTYRDQFDAIGFSSSNGDLSWDGPWIEIGESDGAASGDVRVMNDESDYQLRIRDNNNGGEGVERGADLSGATKAQLSYEYRRMNLDNSSDFVSVEISDNGASGPWVELARHEQNNDALYQSVSHDISDYVSSNTRIRFVTSSTMGNTDTVWFDDVRIDCGS